MKEKEVPLNKQLKILACLCLGFIVCILVIQGSDLYIQRYNFPRWLELVFNVLSFLLAIAAGGAMFSHYVELLNKKENKVNL